ncbi:MAG: cell division protein FtsQ/DivIB, partial [Terriglobia bacterium]
MATPEQIPAGVDWEDDQCSPYRRRHRPVGVRRGRGGRAVRLLRVASLDVLLPLLLIYGVYRCSLHAAASRRFRLNPETDVSFAGNHIASKARMIEALGFGGTGALSVTTLNLSAAQKQVQNLPWVKSATLARIFPHRLEVRVVERTPVAFVNVSGRVELVDSEGMLLQIPAKASFDFPVLYGLDSAPSLAERKDRLDLYLQFRKDTRKEIAGSGWTVSEADLSRPDDLRVLLV